MDNDDRPQVYLLTPDGPDPDTFPELLARVLDAASVACLRLRMAGAAEGDVIRMADALREVAHARDVPLVIDIHAGLVGRLGLDGVHLTDGAKSVRKVRKALGAEAIVGTSCGDSRHEGLNAGEAGADYVAFGPIGATGLGLGDPVDPGLFAWWSEMIELPIVAEGALDSDSVARLSPVTDFIALGEEVWGAGDPAAELQRLIAAMG